MVDAYGGLSAFGKMIGHKKKNLRKEEKKKKIPEDRKNESIFFFIVRPHFFQLWPTA